MGRLRQVVQQMPSIIYTSFKQSRKKLRRNALNLDGNFKTDKALLFPFRGDMVTHLPKHIASRAVPQKVIHLFADNLLFYIIYLNRLYSWGYNSKPEDECEFPLDLYSSNKWLHDAYRERVSKISNGMFSRNAGRKH